MTETLQELMVIDELCRMGLRRDVAEDVVGRQRRAMRRDTQYNHSIAEAWASWLR